MKTHSYCAICDTLLSANNDSKEHVITEAIGGRLKVGGFICKSCNNDTGRTWDAKLASQLLPLSHVFGVTRQRGTTPALPITTTTGEKLTMKPDGRFVPSNPSFLEENSVEGVRIKITARTIDEAKKCLWVCSENTQIQTLSDYLQTQSFLAHILRGWCITS